ncbi:hypothetical protein Tco_0203462, partial [Tanacetum coccineum]
MVAATEPTTIQSDVLKAGILTDEAIRNGPLRKNAEKKGNGGELSRDGNVRDDNKRSRTGRAFSIVTNPVRKEYTGTAPKAGPRMVTSLNARNPTTARGAYHALSVVAIAFKEGQGHGNIGNPTQGRAFVMGEKEARQDPNIVT